MVINILETSRRVQHVPVECSTATRMALHHRNSFSQGDSRLHVRLGGIGLLAKI